MFLDGFFDMTDSMVLDAVEIEVGETHKYAGKTRVIVKRGDEVLTIISTKNDGYEIIHLTANPNYAKPGHSYEKSHVETVLAREPDLKTAKLTAVAILAGEIDPVADYDGSWSSDVSRFDQYVKPSTISALRAPLGPDQRLSYALRAMVQNGIYCDSKHWIALNDADIERLTVIVNDDRIGEKLASDAATNLQKRLAEYARNAHVLASIAGCRKHKADGQLFYLVRGVDGAEATVSAQFVMNIMSRYPNATIGIDGVSTPVAFFADGQCVGGIMPLS